MGYQDKGDGGDDGRTTGASAPGEIVRAYLDAIKVQKVDLKLSHAPSKVKGQRKPVPMALLTGVDGEALRRLNTKFKILSRGFDVDAALGGLGLRANFVEYCTREEAVKREFLYTVDHVGSVILTGDVEKFKGRVHELQVEAEKLQGRLASMLRGKIYGCARELYRALAEIWGRIEPAWWRTYREEHPLDTRGREDVFCDLVYREIESAFELKRPEFRVLFTRFNPDIAEDRGLREAFKRAFRQYLRAGSGRNLDWLIGKDPQDKQGRLF